MVRTAFKKNVSPSEHLKLCFFHFTYEDFFDKSYDQKNTRKKKRETTKLVQRRLKNDLFPSVLVEGAPPFIQVSNQYFRSTPRQLPQNAMLNLNVGFAEKKKAGSFKRPRRGKKSLPRPRSGAKNVVSLRVIGCFEAYHTKENYWQYCCSNL